MTYKIQIDDEIRNATPEEAARIDAQRAAGESEAAAGAAKKAAAESARAKLAALGLNENEIAAIIGA
jgi:hypothetical protein